MPRRSSTSRAKTWAVRLWQVVALLGALSLGLPDAWRALHVALVEHVACPYDGALVHEEELPAAVRARSGARDEAHQKSFIPEHHHHGCAGNDCYQHPSPTPTVSEAALDALLTSEVLDDAAPRSEWSRSVLSYAPKLPPPRITLIG